MKRQEYDMKVREDLSSTYIDNKGEVQDYPHLKKQKNEVLHNKK
jgi:hypothetical protein